MTRNEQAKRLYVRCNKYADSRVGNKVVDPSSDEGRIWRIAWDAFHDGFKAGHRVAKRKGVK